MPNRLKAHFSAGKVRIEVSGQEADNQLVLDFRINSDHDCLLHWGLSKRRDLGWHTPPECYWPKETTPFDRHAVQSVCNRTGGQESIIRIRLDLACPWHSLPFVLYFPDEGRWLRNNGQDFRV